MTTATATKRRRTTPAKARTKTTTGKTAKPTAKAAAKPAAQPPRYAAEAAAVADRLKAADAAGFTRPVLRALTGLSDSAVWRAQRGRVHAGEVATLTDVLDRIAAGEVRPPERVAGRKARTAQAVHALEAALGERTLTNTRKLITEALALLNPSADRKKD